MSSWQNIIKTLNLAVVIENWSYKFLCTDKLHNIIGFQNKNLFCSFQHRIILRKLDDIRYRRKQTYLSLFSHTLAFS